MVTGHDGRVDAENDQTPTGEIRVLIADDSTLLVDTLVAALADHPTLRVVGAAGDGPATLAGVAEHRPDVVLMDLRLGGTWGLDLVPELGAAGPAPAVVVFSAALDGASRQAAREVGVAGEVPKGAPLQAIVDALVAAANRR